MANYQRWLLLVPILILVIATGILVTTEKVIQKRHYVEQKKETAASTANLNVHRSTPNREATFREELRSNRESVYPFVLFGAGFLVALLLLPKLAEFTFSPTSGISLKVLQEVQETIADVKNTALAVEVKARQSFRANAAPETLLAPQPPDVQSEIRKLEESTLKLDAYARLLESLVKEKKK